MKSYSSFSIPLGPPSWPVLCSLFSSLTSGPCHTIGSFERIASSLPFFFPFLPTFHVHPSFGSFFRPLFAPFSLLARPHSLSLSARNCLNGLLFALLPCFLLFRLAFPPNESFSRKLANCRTRFSKIDRKQGLRDWCYSRKIARDGVCWSVKRIITRNFRN